MNGTTKTWQTGRAAGWLLARDDVVYVAKIGLFQFDVGCARLCSTVVLAACSPLAVRPGKERKFGLFNCF